MFKQRVANLVPLFLLLSGPSGLLGETGYEAWLRYPLIKDPVVLQHYSHLPGLVVVGGRSAVLDSAAAELARGLKGMLGVDLRQVAGLPEEDAIVLGTLETLRDMLPELKAKESARPETDGFWLKRISRNHKSCFIITGATDRAVL